MTFSVGTVVSLLLDPLFTLSPFHESPWTRKKLYYVVLLHLSDKAPYNKIYILKQLIFLYTVHIKDDEDILPLLIKEFPHLHLSMHTWHELWRKGINQIEQVTRANQEMRRKKSKAKTDVSIS